MHNNKAPCINFHALVLLACVLAMSPAAAQDSSLTQAGQQPVFLYSASAAEPVIEYTLVHHMLAQPDPEPLLRIYGDGRVHVHFPVYMQRAGDYRLHMSPTELRDLLDQLATNGILDHDPAAASREKQQLEATQRAATGQLFHVSDTTDTLIRIRLDQYRRTPADPPVNGFDREFRWRNLETDARRFPSSDRIMRAARAAASLHALCHHPRLQPLP